MKKQPKEPWQKELRRIVKFLRQNNSQSNKLWDVLTALRGPDLYDPFEDSKRATTCLVRHAIGLQFGDNGAIAGIDTEDSVIYRNDKIFGPDRDLNNGHFRSHIMRAFDALGLSVTSFNPIKERIYEASNKKS